VVRARRRTLASDLSAMLRAALASDPAMRYLSAGHFADDIRRFLRDEPLEVHAPSASYRLSKFIQRHRIAAAVSSGFVATLVLTTTIAVSQAYMARREAVRANSLRDFVLQLFDASRANLPMEQRPTPESL